VEKCKVLNIELRNREEPYALNGAPLGIIKEEKDLDVIVCKNVKVGNSVSKPHRRVSRCWG